MSTTYEYLKNERFADFFFFFFFFCNFIGILVKTVSLIFALVSSSTPVFAVPRKKTVKIGDAENMWRDKNRLN